MKNNQTVRPFLIPVVSYEESPAVCIIKMINHFAEWYLIYGYVNGSATSCPNGMSFSCL